MHQPTLRQQKRHLRADMRALLARITPETRAEKSLAITRAILASPEWRDAAVVCAFVGTAREVDTEALCTAALNQGKTLALPRVTDHGLSFLVVTGWPFPAVVSAFGIPEPPAEAIPLGLCDGEPSAHPGRRSIAERPILIITPGLAFDRRGGRLGQGGGYYDRFFHCLQSIPPVEGQRSWTSVAVAFGFQLVDSVPRGAADQPVHAVATDREGLIRIPGDVSN